MKKLLKEFKDFINRGSVLDLAVGMIIGGAFTAIITAVVTGILKPLINLIPLGDGQTMQYVLKPEEVDKITGAVIREAVVLDFGAVISAIITFLCTAIVLFLVIKAINSAKKAADKAKEEAEKLAKKKEEEAAAAVEEAPVEEAAPAEPVETSDDVLKEIRDLLKAQSSKEE